jgi:GrpB-like predicted nucleotidyltransferase (UPF0157 family)/ADP-ribose pyrophosphatase YjhB (NUDIX family)
MPEWERLFEEEKAVLVAALGNCILDIQHVGSTSIPDIPAKPIIDIAIAVEDFAQATACIRQVIGLGYEYRGENGIPRRHYFVKRDPLTTHHIHMVEKTSWDWETLLLFRDRLRQEPELAREYAELKTALAQEFVQDRDRYLNGKAPFIERVIGRRPVPDDRFESLTALPLARRWRDQTYPVTSVLAIIRRDVATQDGAESQILLIQRQKEPYAGKWGLVGGRWEFGERLESAVTREVKEETGLDATFIALRGVASERIVPGSEHVDGAHYVLFICELLAPIGTAQEQSEGPVAWFSPQDISALHDRQAIIVTDHAILERFSQIVGPPAFLEVEVVAGDGASVADQLVWFDGGTQSDQGSAG